MNCTIDPADFTRLMAMPATDRHDLLEFLGSTLAGHVGTAELLRRAANVSMRAETQGPETGRRGDAH